MIPITSVLEEITGRCVPMEPSLCQDPHSVCLVVWVRFAEVARWVNALCIRMVHPMLMMFPSVFVMMGTMVIPHLVFCASLAHIVLEVLSLHALNLPLQPLDP